MSIIIIEINPKIIVLLTNYKNHSINMLSYYIYDLNIIFLPKIRYIFILILVVKISYPIQR